MVQGTPPLPAPAADVDVGVGQNSAAEVTAAVTATDSGAAAGAASVSDGQLKASHAASEFVETANPAQTAPAGNGDPLRPVPEVLD